MASSAWRSSGSRRAANAKLLADQPSVEPLPELARITSEIEEHATLNEIARLTGGEAMIDATRLQALGRAVVDTRAYYWLAFTPEWLADDQVHRIKLKVDRPGVTVRHRKEFRISRANRRSR